jgi:Tfp pilus assembly protein PilW
MKLNPLSSTNARAFTLVEMMISVPIGIAFLGSLALATTALQTTVNATDEYYKATSDQMRVLDFISLDMRRAVSGSVSNNTQTLTLNLLDYIDYSLNPPTPRTPTIAASGVVTYGAGLTPPTAVYTVTGSSPNQTITRTYTPPSGPATQTTLSGSADYQFSCFDPNNAGSTADFFFGGAGQAALITAQITFKPRYNRLSLGTSRAATTCSTTMLLRNHK